MSRFTAILLAVFLSIPFAAHAQSESAFVGYAGLITTPVGGFTPVVSGKPNAGVKSTGLQLRVARWSFDGVDDNTTNIGAGLVLGRGRTRTVLEAGYLLSEGCNDCGIMMAGADLQYDLAQSTGSGATLVAMLNPAVGVGVPTEGGGSVVTVGLSLPLSASINAGTQLRVVPFVSPGFGFSWLSDSGDSQTGSRAMLGGGVSVGGQSSPLIVTVSARKIFLDGAPTIWGLGMGIAR